MRGRAMDEKKWLRALSPEKMLLFLGERASDRKLRLFACACCRRAWHFARRSKRLNEILPLVEGYADGTVKDRALKRAHELSLALANARVSDAQQCLGWELCNASRKKLEREEWDYDYGESAAAAFGWAAGTGKFDAAKRAELRKQAPLVREVFGNPFRPVSFSPEWRTDTAMSLARQMYEAREFSAAPILADALQDAGCDSEDLLSHLRDTTATHVRGCWALDLVLGKE